MRGSAGTQTYLSQTQTIQSTAQVILELNQNRFLTLSQVSDSIYNAGDKIQYFKNKFAMEDVALPNRPVSGAVRVRYGRYPSHKSQRAATMNNAENTSVYNSAGYWIPNSRLYMTNTKPDYRYFSSQSLTGTFGVTYTAPTWTNKVVVKIENSLEWPTAWVIQVRISGVWTTIATNPSVDPSVNRTGVVSVYRSGGVWSTTETISPQLADAVQIEGIQLVVTAMNASTSHINIIELSPRLTVDATPYFQGWTWGENLSEQDELTPVGTVSSGSGDATFSNTGQDWESRITSATPKLSDFAVKHTKIISYETINSERLKMFTVYADKWTVTEGDTASVSTFDRATIAQATNCPELLMRNVSPTAAIIRMMDQAGLAGYKIRRVSGESEATIPYFFCDKTQNVWDVIKELCKSHQYAVWMDADGDLNIATRNWLYGRASSPAVWTFRSENQLPAYADIISHSEATNEPVNSVTINFKEQLESRAASNNTSTTWTSGLVAGAVANMEFTTRNLWDSNRRPVLLGCVNLTGNIDAVQTTINVDVNAFRNDMWDFPVGYAYVDQEVIKLGAARFGYVNSAGSYVTADIENVEDLKLMEADAVGRVIFTGQFVNCTRGAFGTTAAAHTLALSDWVKVAADAKYASIVQDSTTGNGWARLHKASAGTDYKMAMVRDLGRSYSKFYTKITIPNQSTPQRAGGMVIWANTNGSNALTSGWYVELRSSEKQKNELALVRILSTGALDRAHQKVYNVQINEGSTYELVVMVVQSPKGSAYTRMRIFVNTHTIADLDVLNSQVPKTSKVAVMATGRSLVQFDLFAAATGALTDDSYVASVANILHNVFAENSSAHQGVVMFYEGFDNKLRGLYVQDVVFNNGPAMSVKLWATMNQPSTNKLGNAFIAKSTDVVAALDKSTPFSTRVAIGNLASTPLALDDGTQSIYPFIYGSVVETSATVQVNSTDENSIRRLGTKKYEASPNWIASKGAAQAVADWIVKVGTSGLVVHTIESFDNPLVEIGDIVTIYYPAKNMNATEKFVVYDISRSRSEGISTTVKAVKIVP